MISEKEPRIRKFKYKDSKPIIPAYIEKIMKQVSCIGCYTYILRGIDKQRPAYGVDNDIEKLCVWAEGYGAEFIIKKRNYGVRNHYIIFEMTDPIAHALEKAGMLE